MALLPVELQLVKARTRGDAGRWPPGRGASNANDADGSVPSPARRRHRRRGRGWPGFPNLDCRRSLSITGRGPRPGLPTTSLHESTNCGTGRLEASRITEDWWRTACPGALLPCSNTSTRRRRSPGRSSRIRRSLAGAGTRAPTASESPAGARPSPCRSRPGEGNTKRTGWMRGWVVPGTELVRVIA